MNRREKAMLVMGALIMSFGLGIILYNYVAAEVLGEREAVYETYTVKRGDTFWTISEIYRLKDSRKPYILEYKYELERLNGDVKPGELRAGDKIKIRYYVAKEGGGND